MENQTFTVKLDAADATAILAKYVEPGAVLLSAETVRNLAGYLAIDEQLLNDHMNNAGAIFAAPGEQQSLGQAIAKLSEKG